MILSTLDKSRKGGAYEQIPSLVLGQRWTPQLNSRNMMKVVLCVWIEPYIENDLSFCVWPVHTPTTSKEVLTLSASTSPLPYTGNKSCIVNTILSVMPKHTVYIDPCMGSAEVFFRKPRAEKEILNDYNGDLVNLFRVIQNNEKLAYLLGRLYLSINGELAFKQNKDRLKGVPNILDDVIETSQIFYDASWEDIQNAAAFLENQVYSFSSTGQTFGIARRDMSQRLPRLMSAYNRIRDAIILHRDYKDVITYAACPGSFILLDPPYKGTEDMYSKANFDIEQHDILFSFMSEVNQQHHGEVKFLITYNNDPYIRGVAEKHGFDTFVQTRLHSMKQSKEAGALYSLSEAERLNEEELWQDNRDAEVSHTQLTEMFRHSDPAALMDEAEQAQLAELDDTVTVYRGVTTINSDNLLALSWTLDYETADWFARRFDEDGTVYKAQIDRHQDEACMPASG